MKLNCWQVKKCGREPGGERVSEFGVCPAAAEAAADEVNEGTNGGRICWAIAGTLCAGKVQGSYAAKLGTCTECEFYQRVVREQGADLQRASAVLARLPQHRLAGEASVAGSRFLGCICPSA